LGVYAWPAGRIEEDMKRTLLITLGITLLLFTGCTQTSRNPTPDQIRQDAAKATRTAAQDTKAAVEGVVDGLKTRGQVNINSATTDQLKALPGIDDDAAHRIADGRPYKSTDELPRRHLISRVEYDKISNQIVAQ
jgi:DNA uptake protein ComE-like DNA-binding protein